MKAGAMRHRVNVMRPTKALDERGQLQGTDETIFENWPCSIDTLSGSKAANERMVVPNATHKVEGYGDPKKPFKEHDFLTFSGRTLAIEFINDVMQNGVQLTLICSEQKNG